MIITDKATLRENEKYHTSESPHFLHYLCLVPNEYCTASPRFSGEHFIYITKTVSKTWAITRFGPRGFMWISACWNCAKVDGWNKEVGSSTTNNEHIHQQCFLVRIIGREGVVACHLSWIRLANNGINTERYWSWTYTYWQNCWKVSFFVLTFHHDRQLLHSYLWQPGNQSCFTFLYNIRFL